MIGLDKRMSGLAREWHMRHMSPAPFSFRSIRLNGEVTFRPLVRAADGSIGGQSVQTTFTEQQLGDFFFFSFQNALYNMNQTDLLAVIWLENNIYLGLLKYSVLFYLGRLC